MMRIFFVSTLAYNYFFPGKIKQAGGHTRIYNLSRALAKLPGYKIYCITGDFGQENIIEKDGVTLLKAPINNPMAFFKVFYLLYKLRPDILIDLCASPRLFLYRLLKKISGLKYVFLTSCDNDVNGNYKNVENRFFDILYNKGLKKTDRIIAQVPEHKKLLKENFNLDADLILSPYFEIKKKPPQNKEYVLWVGRAAFYKRPDLFVKLAKKFSDQKFVMICNKSGYDNGFMQNIRSKDFLPGNFEFHEYVEYPEMNFFFKKAKLLINTSDYEGFPNTFIEAAVNFTPVLSLNSDPNGMLSIHKAGIACSGSFEKMYENCQEMISNDDGLKNYGQKAFNYAFENHRIEIAVEKFDHIFKFLNKTD